MSSGLTDCSQRDWKAYSDRVYRDDQTLHISAPIDESPPFACLNYLAEDQAQSLATELKALNLDPVTSRNVIDTMKRHLLRGIRSYLGCGNTNGSAMSPSTVCPCLLPHSPSLSECTSSASPHPFPGKARSADVLVPPNIPSPNSTCGYTCAPTTCETADASPTWATRFDLAPKLPEPVTDTAKIALSLYLENAPETAAGDPHEQPRTLPPAEAQLEARLNVQLRAGLRQLNEIFIQWPVERRLALLRSSPAWRKSEDAMNQRTKSVSLPATRLTTVSRRQFSESSLPRSFRRSRPTSVATPKIASGDSAVAGRAINVASPRRTLSLPPPTGLHSRLLGHRLPHALPICSGGDAQQRNPSATLQRHPFASARATATPRCQSRPRWQPSYLEVPIPPRPIELINPPAYIDISPCIRRRKVIHISARDRPRALLGGRRRGSSPGKQQRGFSAGNRLPVSPGPMSRSASSRTHTNGAGKSVRPITTTRRPQACSAIASTAECGVLTEPTREFSVPPRDVTSGPGIVYKNRFPHSSNAPRARARSKSASPFYFPSTVRLRSRHGHQEDGQSGAGSNQSNAVIVSCVDRSQGLSRKSVAPRATKTPTAAKPESRSPETTCLQIHDGGGDAKRWQHTLPVQRRIVHNKPRQQVAPKQRPPEHSIRPVQESDDSFAEQQREQRQLEAGLPSNNVSAVSAGIDSSPSNSYQDRVLRLTWSMESCTVPCLLRDNAELPSSLQLGCF
nr:unnamed protein product [Spirometra erinaceieuropaei]